MNKTKAQEERKLEIKTLLGQDAQIQADAVDQTMQMNLYDESQLHDDVLVLGEKKKWVRSEEDAQKNRMIDRSLALTKLATADTLMVHDTIRKMKKWKVEDDHAFRLLMMTDLTSKMLISANIRAHYGEYMQIVRCYEQIQKKLRGHDNTYAERLGEKLTDLALFYDRMKAYTEQNRIHMDGTVMKEKEEAFAFSFDRGKILKGDVFKYEKPEEYDFTEVATLDKEALKKVLSENDKADKYTVIEALTETMHKDRHMGFKMHRYHGDQDLLKKYDTTESRIAEIADMREQIRYIENALDEKGNIQKKFDFPRALSKRTDLKRERLEIISRLNLAEAEARLALAIGEKNTAVIKAAQAEVLDAWDDYRRIQRCLAKESMPLTAHPVQASTMTKSEAVTSETDQQNYVFKKQFLTVAESLPDDIPQLKRVKDLALAYGRETHYTIGCDEEAELLGELYKAMAAAEKDGYGEHLVILNDLKNRLNYSTIPDFDDIPDTTNLQLFEDTKIVEGMKLDFSDTVLKENGSHSDDGYYRNGLMNNDLIRKWVDVSDQPIFPHEPTVNDLRQGKVSNCYMLAATTSLIQHDPQAIKHVIRDNGDGTATVRLYRSPGEPVFIRVKKVVPRLRATGGAILTSGPLWMQLIEMAAAHVGMFTKDKEGKTKTGVGSLWYGTGAGWFQMLTGVPAMEQHQLLSADEDGAPVFMERSVNNADLLFEKIKDVISKNCVVHMGTKQKTSNGMNSGHAYTVLGAREINGKKYITLRNPYANMSFQKSENGTQTMSSSYFSSVADATCGQFDIPIEDFIQNARNVSFTDLSEGSKSGKFYFADEQVTLKEIADHGGKVPGLDSLNIDQQRLFESMDIDDDILTEEIMPKTREVETFEPEVVINDERTLEQRLTDEMYEKPEYDKLMRSQKTFGDSKLMKAVKVDLFEVEKLLNQPWTEEFTSATMKTIRDTYFKAIAGCDAYLAERSSTRKTGMDRRALVEQNKNRLIRELEFMETAGELLLNGRLMYEEKEDTTFTLRSLLVQAKLYDFAAAPENKISREKEKTSRADSESLQKVLDFFSPSSKAIKDKKQASEYAASVAGLRRELKAFPQGKAYSCYVKLGDAQVMILQDEAGVVTITNSESSVAMKETIPDLVGMLEYKMIEEQDRMNAEDLKDVFSDQTVEMTMIKRGRKHILTKNAGDVQKVSARLARYLELKTKKPATYFSNFGTDLLRTLAYGLASGAKVDVVLKELERIEKKTKTTSRMINTSETLELVRSTKQKKEEVAKKVTYKPVAKTKQQKQKERLLELNGWEEEEFAVKNMLSDLVFSMDTWEADDSVTEPGERIRRMLISHKETLALIVADNYREDQTSPSLVNKILEKLPVALAGDEGDDFKVQVKAAVGRINAMIDVEMEKAVRAGKSALGKNLSKEETDKKVKAMKRNPNLIRTVISAVLTSKNADVMAELKRMDADIEKSVQQSSERLQQQIILSMGELFRADGTEGADPTAGLLDPLEKNIPEEEKKKRIQAQTDALGKILENSMKGESGQGLFIKNIFANYFKGADILDRRSMFAAALRNAAPAAHLDPLPENADEELKKKYKAKLKENRQAEMGRYLGGLLKGAGPLFQKILQGLPASTMNEHMQNALQDVKSKLAPIPEEIVKAQLYGMVERSKGKITKIEISRALGAASVGQTFLCKIYGPEIPKKGKDVVVKLLKPDVRNRMMREKAVMLACAKQTDAGMVATYEGQLSRIEEELDLTIEARNVVKGKIYDKTTDEEKKPDGVQAMKLVDMVEATTNSMMLEMAPGETVDRYLKETTDHINTYREALIKREDETESDFAIRINLMRENIARDMAELTRRQVYMAILSKKWVTEGIFGEGFYHGDLHAGNIMINDEGVTVIDFGNATTLDDKQQVNVTRMVGAAAVGDEDGFMDGLYNLIKPEFHKIFDNQKNILKGELKKIFALGDQNAAGQRVAVALIKTQELGIEVPSAIFNFSQCQLRLQSAVDDMIKKIEDLQRIMRQIDKTKLEDDTLGVDFYIRMMDSMSGTLVKENKPEEPRDMMLREFNRSVSINRKDFDLETLEMHDQDIEDGSFIKKNKLDKFYKTDGDQLKAAIDGFINTLFVDGIKPLRAGENIPVDYALTKNIDFFVPFQEHLTAIVPYYHLKQIATYYFERYQELKDKEDADPKELKSLVGEGDTPPAWVNALKDYLYGKADIIGRFIQKSKAYDAVRNDAAIDPTVKEEAKNAFKEEYKVFKLSELIADNETYVDYLDREDLQEDFYKAVQRAAESDPELAPELMQAYEDYRAQFAKFQKNKLVMLPYEEKLVGILMRIAGKRFEAFYENMFDACSMKPKNFVSVMGVAISENLTKSLDRLGFIAAYSYKRKLS
ncbi:MAG: phosphotransferase [Lachnospiraceae bacterium]|nr:phosphotransferase [Lachnospiraceae bacterium]